jgi:hypothetical protein
MKYRAAKDVLISSTGKGGDAFEFDFSKGYIETKDEDEIEVLDRLATDPDNPVGFDPKDKGEK